MVRYMVYIWGDRRGGVPVTVAAGSGVHRGVRLGDRRGVLVTVAARSKLGLYRLRLVVLAI